TSRVRRLTDSRGFARPDRWFAGSNSPLPAVAARWSSVVDVAQAARAVTDELPNPRTARTLSATSSILAAARAGHALTEDHVARLFAVEGRDLDEVIAAADELRQESVGDTVTYVVNRNINYTNICLYH